MMTFLLLTALCVFAICGSAFATEIAVVNVDKIFAESKPAAAARAHLEQVQKTLQAGYDQLAAKNKGKEQDANVQQVLLEAQYTLNNQMAVESQAVDQVLFDLVHQAVVNFKKANKKYDVVLSNRLVLDYSDGVDVTADVLKEMNKLTAKFADLPKVTVK